MNFIKNKIKNEGITFSTSKKYELKTCLNNGLMNMIYFK